MQKMTQLLLELKREQEEKEAFWEKMSADLIEKNLYFDSAKKAREETAGKGGRNP